jgi:phosphoglycolate phosphatase
LPGGVRTGQRWCASACRCHEGDFLKVRIVFDLDGTLIDSAPDIQGAANRLLAPHGTQITLVQTRDFIGNGLATFISRMLAAVDLPADLHTDLLATFEHAYLTAVDATTLYPQVRETLAALRAQGHTLGICSNKPLAPCMAVLDHLALTPLFGTVWGGDSLARRKPDPAPLHAALAALGQGPCIYVGDSEVDAQTALSAGVPFLLFTEGYRKSAVAEIAHTAAFSDFADLPALVLQYAE